MTSIYSPILTTTMTTETFHLVRNKIDIGRLRLLLGLGIFVIPTLLANAVFASSFHLEGTGLVIATSLTGILLLNLTLFLLHKAKRGNRTLIFGFNHLRVIEETEAVKVIPFENLTIIPLTHGLDEDKRFPAIRIKAEELGCMTIGSTQSSNQWQATEAAIDCTAYLIPSEEEWKRFMEIINQFK